MNLSDNINHYNITNIRNEINKKNSTTPYTSTQEQGASAITDFDSFPYNRWYRGRVGVSDPVIIEREAGFRARKDDCYKFHSVNNNTVEYPNHCFETACSTVFPCYPQYFMKESDRKALNVILNNACIAQST